MACSQRRSLFLVQFQQNFARVPDRLNKSLHIGHFVGGHQSIYFNLIQQKWYALPEEQR